MSGQRNRGVAIQLDGARLFTTPEIEERSPFITEHLNVRDFVLNCEYTTQVVYNWLRAFIEM